MQNKSVGQTLSVWPVGNKNYILNSNFDVNQRFGPGGSKTLPLGVPLTYIMDRWRAGVDGTGVVVTVSQQAFTLGAAGNPPGEPQWFHRFNQTTAGSGTAFSRVLEQFIEGVRTLAGQTVTLSFWAKADTAGRVLTCFLQQYFGSGGSPSALVSVTSQANTLSTTWQKFTYTVALPSISGKTLGSNPDSSLLVTFISGGNAVQIYDIAQVKLERGPIATYYEKPTFDEELRFCKRYFQKSFGYATTPTQNTNAVGASFVSSQAAGIVNQNMIGTIYLQETLRVSTATATFYNPHAANAFATNLTNGGNTTTLGISGISENSFFVIATTPVANAKGDLYDFHWTLDCEYYN